MSFLGYKTVCMILNFLIPRSIDLGSFLSKIKCLVYLTYSSLLSKLRDLVFFLFLSSCFIDSDTKISIVLLSGSLISSGVSMNLSWCSNVRFPPKIPFQMLSISFFTMFNVFGVFFILEFLRNLKVIPPQKWNQIGVNFCYKHTSNYSQRLSAVIATKGHAIKFLFLDLCPKLVRTTYNLNPFITADAGVYLFFLLKHSVS